CNSDLRAPFLCSPFFFHYPAPPYISTLSLHDALPICHGRARPVTDRPLPATATGTRGAVTRRDDCHRRAVSRSAVCRHPAIISRSEEHTSELQSLTNIVCRLLLEKKKRLQQNALLTTT